MTRGPHDPPRLASAWMAQIAPVAWGEHFLGDLAEEYASRARTSRPRADLWYWRQVARVAASKIARRSPDVVARFQGGLTVTSLARDLVLGLRLLGRQKAFTAIVVLALGVSLGAAGAAIGLTRIFFWTPLPYPDSDRLVRLNVYRPDVPTPEDLNGMDWSGLGDVADLSVAWDIDGFTIVGDGRPMSVDGRWIRADVFPMFGIAPAAGRMFTDDEASRHVPVAVIGHRLWQERYGGSADVIGRSITIRSGDRPDEVELFQIVGVLPPRFWHLDERTQLLLPLRGPRVPSLLRLRPGVTPTQAAERATALVRSFDASVDPRWQAEVISQQDAHVAPLRPVFQNVMLAVVLLVLVTCGNLAFLQLARGLSRQREMAVRSARVEGRSVANS